MVVPVGGYINQVDVGTLAELFIALLAGVDVGGSEALFLQILLAAFSTGGHVVAEGNNFHTGDVAEAVNCTGTAHTEADEGHADGLDLGGGETQNVLLSGRTGGGVNNDRTLVPMPLRGGRERLGGSGLAAECEDGCHSANNQFFELHKVISLGY